MWSSKLFFLIGLVTVAFFLRKRFQKIPPSERFLRHANADNTKKHGGESNVSNKKKRLYPTLFDPDLKKRALVNRRLVRMFGLENAFTTEDKEQYDRYMSLVRKKLGAFSDAYWVATSRHASICSGYLIEKTQKSGALNLASLVQCLTFRIMLSNFISDTLHPSDSQIELLADRVNSLWMASKDPEVTPEKEEASKRDLFVLLDDIFGEPVVEGEKNPLNLIIPAYESIWRVVFRCFLEVRFRSSLMQRQNFEESLARFLKAPKSDTFGYGDQNSTPVAFLVNEALRMYPPTRRISRQTKSGIIKVDIESMHRDPEIWGTDASCFRPSRWIQIPNEAKVSFIPFGAGKFECPAKRTVGPMMIGLLVASLTTVLGDGFTLSEELKEGPLPNEREALKDLKLLFH
ncbi:cytochrome P450/P450 [Blumeria hordei DH14]|uniref:Cytochrome P450/P450 n=1 Tax=Blumeria graminis f. sp. hordei (strain DH14) TaxID=546991 RepID=N1J5A5_BLUG1|nr:cytochrome P450/P450 [Blumeria hordei DH14]